MDETSAVVTAARSPTITSRSVRWAHLSSTDAGVRTFADVEPLVVDPTRLDALETRLRSVPGHGGHGIRLGYFWMLVGNDDVIKPDRMIVRWLNRAVGRQVSPGEARSLLTAAADDLGCTPWELDHAIWLAERT